MCGIAGVWWPQGHKAEQARRVVGAMCDALRHRGPDAQGQWLDERSGLILGHRRLAVVDRTQAGAQPMLSASGRYVLTYNGEIYNHLALRDSLTKQGLAPPWRGHSDTETLVAAFEAWGIEATLRASAGMFALALWDREAQTLTLARDRIGEKPLYYGRAGPTFAFASELRALRCIPGFHNSVDPAAAAALLSCLHVPDPLSIHAGVFKLLPGHLVMIREGQAGESAAWWSLEEQMLERGQDTSGLTLGELADRLEQVLGEVIDSQLLSDVPLGSFLSGGIDSSLVTAIMQARADRPVRTYSIGFAEAEHNEAPHARAVAQHLGTRHTEYILEDRDALEIVPQLPALYDEPFADSSQIPTVLLARLARADITVALTGDGGDEVFGGYPRYSSVPPVLQRVRHVHRSVRSIVGGAAELVANLSGSPGLAGAALAAIPFLPDNLPPRAERAARLLKLVDDPTGFDSELNRVAGDGRALLHPDLRRGLMQRNARTLGPELLAELGVMRWMMGNDLLGFLPGDILVKVDRAAMAASLETRAPLLDVRVLDFAASLPDTACVSGGTGKRVMRELLWRHVPRELCERKKQGFSIPLDAWLRGSLREWAEDLLSPAALSRTNLLDQTEVRRIWLLHCSGRVRYGSRIWAALMLQAWALAR